MRELILKRENEDSTNPTLGTLRVAEKKLYTIERPWIPDSPGGKPSLSCVPAGRYRLIRHKRPRTSKLVPALINPGLSVFYRPEDRPNGVGRSLILIHSGNWVTNVIGCIAPGTGRGEDEKGPRTYNSRDAMEIIMAYDPESILILGAEL